ncbi:unnamed protein product [Calicophoron daubneyi]|uniref:GSKIP domain-containing protein n=1 Tax=Calicophoron daubneyi TaxID=300641 RepID=A0AAV2T7Z4_CALDB
MLNRCDPPDFDHQVSDTDTKLCSVEAAAAIKEVAFGVKDIQMASESLPCTDSLAYINLTTLEDEPMCVEISVKGFCPVGDRYNETQEQTTGSEYYETIYALLSARSRSFRDRFSQRVCDRLQGLCQTG